MCKLVQIIADFDEWLRPTLNEDDKTGDDDRLTTTTHDVDMLSHRIVSQHNNINNNNDVDKISSGSNGTGLILTTGRLLQV